MTAAVASWPAAVSAVLQLVCYGGAWACVLAALLFQFVLVLPWWNWDSRDENNVWQRFRTLAQISYGMREDSLLYSGRELMKLTFTWLPLAGASVLTLVPAVLLSKRVRAAAWEAAPMRGLRAGFRAVCRVTSYPMYPQRFWLWWCNGFSVFDALVMALFLIGHIIAIWQITDYYRRRFVGWDVIGLDYPQPKRVIDLEYISLACAWTLYMDFTFIFFPVAHLSFLHKLLGSSWSAVVKYHRWLGHFGLWTLTGHALFFYWYWLTNTDLNFWEEFRDWNTKSSVNYLAGSIAWMAGVVLWVTSLTWFRRRFFAIFYNTHMAAALVWVMFGLMHYSGNYVYLLPGLIAWGADVMFRVFQAQHVSVVSSAHLTSSGDLVRLEIPLDPALAKSIKAGQDVFLQFPDVNRWNWHPFTIYKVNLPSTPDVLPSMTVAIKKYGRWTKALLIKLQQGHACLPVRVVGPVGGLHTIDQAASRVVMFVGGVGASPALASLHRLMDWEAPPTTTVVYAARDAEELTILDERVLEEATRTDNPWLSLKLFCTGAVHTMLSKVHDQATADRFVSNAKLAAPETSSNSGSGSNPDLAKIRPQLESAGAYGCMHIPAAEDGVPARTWLSSFGWRSMQPVQPRLLNNWHLLLAVCLAWLGGFLGVVQAKSAQIEKRVGGRNIRESWTGGLMYLGLGLIQAIGLPSALVVFPVHVARYIRANKKPQPVAVPSSPYVARMGTDMLGSPELAARLRIASGRPDIRSLLAEAIKGAVGYEVPVVVAGPAAMVHQVELAAWEANWRRERDAPFLRVIRETYEM